MQAVIVSPALADASNDNWRTARRWQHMLSPASDVPLAKQWTDAQASNDFVMLALLARRSAPSITAPTSIAILRKTRWHAPLAITCGAATLL